MQSVALVLPDSRIEEAHALAPHNGRIAGRLSQTLYRSGASEADQARAVTIARDALQHDPTAVEAVATLAADAFARGDQAKGERLLASSQKLSRRERKSVVSGKSGSVRVDLGGRRNIKTKKN